MGHSKIEIQNENYTFGAKAKKYSLGILAVGVILFVIGLFNLPSEDALCCIDHKTASDVEAAAFTSDHAEADAHATEEHATDAHADEHAEESHGDAHSAPHACKKSWTARLYATLMMNSYYFLIIGACALFFVGLQYISNAGWAVAVKRIPEAMLTTMPYFVGVLLVVLYLGKYEIYHWATYFKDKANAIASGEAFHADKILDGKAAFLNEGWLLIGTLVIVGVWILFGWKLRTLSKEEDALVNHNRATKTKQFIHSIKFSAAFTFIFAFTFSILSWLIIMSIDAHWFSTIFSIYNFAIGWVSALSIITLFVLFLKKQGYLKLVTDEHIHDLGKFMFAFSIFWAYIWVAQYLLIWYANLPEETVYYYVRYFPEWKPMFGINVVLNFLAPFLLLMTRDGKRNPKILTLAAACILIGHWNDLYLMIMPGSIGTGASIGLLEIGTTVMFAGFFIFMVQRRLTKQSLVPVNHPYIEESVHHDVGP